MDNSGLDMQARLVAAVLASAWLAACGGNYDFHQVQAPPDDEATASSNYLDCLRAADNRLDDGKTDIRTVSVEVAGQCEAQYAALKATLAQNLSGNTRLQFEADMDAKRMVTVSDVVAHGREVRAAPANAGS
jgi:outer membrane PBP1 activator LpoA protein